MENYNLHAATGLIKRKEKVRQSSCLYCTKRCSSLFRDIHPDELKLIDSNKSNIFFKKDEYIFREGSRTQGMVILSDGKVKVSSFTEAGTEFIHSLHGPVDFICIQDHLLGGYYSNSAIALEDSIICLVSEDVMKSVLSTNQDLMQKLCVQMAKELNRSQSRYIALSGKYMRSRMADALIYVRDKFGVDSDGALACELKRNEFAALSNMTASNAIRTLSEFQQSQIINLDGRRIFIRKPELLYKLSMQGS